MDFLIQGPAAWIWAFGGLIVSLGLALAIRAGIGDRARGRRRCPSCWYDMAGVSGLRCPECGREAKLERSLFRARRWWIRGALGAVIVLCGAAICVWPVVREKGVVSLLPNFVLVRLAPKVGTELIWDSVGLRWTLSPMTEELWRRVKNDQLSASGMLSAIRTAGVLQTRSRWPKDQPFVVGVTIPSVWMGPGTLTFTPRAPGLGAASARVVPYDYGSDSFSTEDPKVFEGRQVLGSLEPGTTLVEFDVTFAGSSWMPSRQNLGLLSIPIQLVDTIDEVLPLSRPAVLVPGDISCEVGIEFYRTNGFWITYAPSGTAIEPSVGLAFNVELINDGKLREVVSIDLREVDSRFTNSTSGRRIGSSHFATKLPTDPEEVRKWKVRLTPCVSRLLTTWQYESVADFSAEFPLSEVMRKK